MTERNIGQIVSDMDEKMRTDALAQVINTNSIFHSFIHSFTHSYILGKPRNRF